MDCLFCDIQHKEKKCQSVTTSLCQPTFSPPEPVIRLVSNQIAILSIVVQNKKSAGSEARLCHSTHIQQNWTEGVKCGHLFNGTLATLEFLHQQESIIKCTRHAEFTPVEPHGICIQRCLAVAWRVSERELGIHALRYMPIKARVILILNNEDWQIKDARLKHVESSPQPLR